MLLEFLMFWSRETVSNIGRNRLVSLLAISTVTIGLFILGAFYLTLANLRATLRNQTQKLDLVVILDKQVTPQRRKEIYEAVHIPQVADLQFVYEISLRLCGVTCLSRITTRSSFCV